jgi:hypothetical protein
MMLTASGYAFNNGLLRGRWGRTKPDLGAGHEAILPSGNERALLALFAGAPKLFTFSSNFQSMIPPFGLGAKRHCRARLRAANGAA